MKKKNEACSSIDNLKWLVEENIESSAHCVPKLFISIIKGKSLIWTSGCIRSDTHVFEESSRSYFRSSTRNAICFVGPLKHGYVYSSVFKYIRDPRRTGGENTEFPFRSDLVHHLFRWDLKHLNKLVFTLLFQVSK